MRSYVTFRSPRFAAPAEPLENDDIGFYGEDVARWLHPILASAGLAPGAPVGEDYGWGMWTTAGRNTYWLSFTGGPPDPGDEARGGEFGINIEYDPGWRVWKRLLGRAHPSELATVVHAVHAALAGDAQVTDVAWWDDPGMMGQSSATP